MTWLELLRREWVTIATCLFLALVLAGMIYGIRMWLEWVG